MGMICTEGKHHALPRPIRNQGFEFGRCARCGRDLVRSRRAWRAVPQGFRVVWRRDPPGATDTCAAQLDLNLAPAAATPPSAAEGARGRSRIAAGAELVLLGLRGLASIVAERTRLWLRTRPEARVAIAGVLGPPAR